jgi:predicted Fe-Mo cluster-binding NifX family protein
MKIAVPVTSNFVCQTFDLPCEKFLLFTADNDSIIYEESLDVHPAAHTCTRSVIPELIRRGVEYLLINDIDAKAGEMLIQKGIRVFAGVKGEARGSVELFLQGRLDATELGNESDVLPEFVWNGIAL